MGQNRGILAWEVAIGPDRRWGGETEWDMVGGCRVGPWSPSDVQVGRLRLPPFSAWGLDIRIWELLLLRMESCVPPFTPLLAREG